MNELDENIQILKEEIDYAEDKRYDGMSTVEIMMLYQQMTNLLWMKINILTNKNNG